MFKVHTGNNKFTAFVYRNRIPFLSFLLSAVILEIAYATRGIFPFGPKDVLVVDLYHQYTPFLSELQDKLRSLSGIFYSWSGGLGTDFYSTFAYYLASPLNLLVVLFPKSWLTEAVLLLILIKVGLAGAFFSVYLKEAYGKRDLTVVAFSLMFALSGFTMAYCWNIMWLEGIYLMPLLFLGMIRLIRQDRALLFIVSLALMLYCNFYIAFFAIIFAVFYYPVLIIQFLKDKSFKSIALKTLQTGIFALIGAGAAAVMILPTLSALKLTSAAGSSFPTEITQYFNLFDYIGRHFPISDPVIREGLPNIYCGLASFLLIPVFIMGRKFTRAEKIANVSLLFFLIMSFNLNVLNFIWHGLHFPNQLPFRNSFVYVFLLTTIAFRALEARKEIPNRVWFLLTSVAAGLVLLTQKLGGQTGGNKIPGFPDIYIILLIIGLFTVVFTVKRDGIDSMARFPKLFLIAVLIELTVSTVMVIGKVDVNEYYSSRNGYLYGKDAAALMEEINKIKATETGFYRMEAMPPKTPNDPYLYGYNGVSIFSSMMPERTVSTMENFGFHSNSINSYKNEGSTIVFDSLFGVKYLIRSGSKINDNLRIKTGMNGNLAVYKNPYAVSIAYTAPESFKRWISTPYNPFTVQNGFVEGLTGVKNVFSPLKLETGNTTNAGLSKTDSNHFSYSRSNKDSESRISVRIKDSADRYVYFYLDAQANAADYGYLMVGDKRIDFNAKRSTIVDAGFCKTGETVSMELVYKAGSDLEGRIGVLAFALDEARFKQALAIAGSNSMKVDTFEDTKIRGSVDVKTSGVLFTTIPYNEGWKVRVDGQPAETYAVDEGFLAFDISEGNHTIEMDYMTPQFLKGALISLLSLILISIGMISRWRYFKLT